MNCARCGHTTAPERKYCGACAFLYGMFESPAPTAAGRCANCNAPADGRFEHDGRAICGTCALRYAEAE